MPSSKLMYQCNTSEDAKKIMNIPIDIVRNAQWKHSECPEELEVLQMLCQFLHSHLSLKKEHVELIEWVFTRLEMDHLLTPGAPSCPHE